MTAPTGTVTFLFTDIQGSTQLWEKHPEGMKAALAKHDVILRQAVESNGGQVLKNTGDGILAVFEKAASGVCAALRAQEALGPQAWDELKPDLVQVRMGLHTGEAENRAGDYYGGALNRAARLMSVAHGGQVLLSNTTAEIVREQLPENASLRDLGHHRLKDLVRPEQVFQLDHPSLSHDFPPLTSLDSFPNNLPLQSTSFVGREHEMAKARERLSASRLLTLIGPGGTGKTRLSLQLAAEVLPEYPDGVWLVELASLSDPSLILRTVASALHIHEQMGMELEELVLNYVRARQMLLVVDNCEHMVEACAQLIDGALRACPKLKILASSREALGINGETIYRVPSLSLPDPAEATRESLLRSESAQLFVERAEAVDPRFRLTDAHAPSIAQICSRLDGIPLAIELAAARMAVFSPEQIAGRLDDRFKLLTGGSRTALPRQQTLRALIDWSYDTLSQEERALFRRLSVFAGGWSFEAAEAICGDLDVLNLMTQLINKSLVTVEEDGQERRYRFLETIRQYARDKLLEAGEAERMRNAHLACLLKFAEEAGPEMDEGELMQWIPKLEAEHDNFRTALKWSLGTDVIAALRMVVSLAKFWLRRGYAVEGIYWTTEALRVEECSPKDTDEEADRERTHIRARALEALSFLRYSQGDNPGALKAGEECIPLARQLGDERLLAISLTFSGSAKGFLGEFEEALAYLEEAVDLARKKGRGFELVMALRTLASFTGIAHGDYKTAEAYEAEALVLAKEHGENWWGSAMSMVISARGAVMRGDYARARAYLIECLPAFEQLGDVHRVNMVHSELAHMDRYEGHDEKAEAAYRKTILVWQKLGHRAAVAHQLESFGLIAQKQGKGGRAVRLLGAADSLREKINIPMYPAERVEYEKALEHLRLGMDAGEFDSGWSEGRAMGMEEAVDYALS